MFVLLVLSLAGDPDALMAHARIVTAAEHRCERDPDANEVTVCGLRQADRFRVPFAQHAVARADDARSSRPELIHERTPMEDMGPFLVGGGMAGVHAGVSFGPGTGGGKMAAGGLRPLAP